jgi:SAM-dependent methyltransferase
MPSFITIFRGLANGKSLLRIYLNHRLLDAPLEGRVLDIGRGGDGTYLDFLPARPGRTIEPVDPKIGSAIDFERDTFPYADDTFDGVLLLNVLEHVYAYGHLLGEARRLLKPGAPLVGFTPFLIRYHPDPHDFFRYTDEALARMLKDAGFTDAKVSPVGAGPFLAALNIFVISIPHILRGPFAFVAWGLDRVFLRLRPKAVRIYPMGYYFVARK